MGAASYTTLRPWLFCGMLLYGIYRKRVGCIPKITEDYDEQKRITHYGRHLGTDDDCLNALIRFYWLIHVSHG